VDEIPESMPPPPSRPSARRAQAQPNSRVRRQSAGVRRTGSVSDSERDPVMRRKVGDLTRKLDAMTAKYETLKETASSGKESNFEQLKKRTEQIAKGVSLTIFPQDRTNPSSRPRRCNQIPQATNQRPPISHLNHHFAQERTSLRLQRKRTPPRRNQGPQRLSHRRTKRKQNTIIQARRSPIINTARAQEYPWQRSEAANNRRCAAWNGRGSQGSYPCEAKGGSIQRLDQPGGVGREEDGRGR
jgi:hypothetical protein